LGATQQLTAVIRDASGNALTGRQVSWVSSNTSVLIVSDAGLVTAAGVGGATITVTSESTSATTPAITVQPVPVATVNVSPGSATVLVGATQQLVAVTRDAAGNVLTGRPVAWSSGNPAVATVAPNTGLVSAVAPGGPVVITAVSEGKTGASSISVNPIALRASPFVTSGLSGPVFLTQPLDDGRIFVVEQGGRIRVVRNGELQTTPFLNISDRVHFSGEQGLLSVAFHPQYATNHLFYVFFSGLNGEIRIERFTTSADPSVADNASEKLIFTTPHADFTNHNGGLVAFGPDGMLYAGFGDGGSGGDPLGNGQNVDAYLGGMIRIDVDHGDPYAIPADNPFVGQANRKLELWAKGLRNPWRFAFDFPTGLLFIGDVGQNLIEEVDAVPATLGGVNYGWNIMEGTTCYAASTCDQTGLRLPIVQYDHTGACSVTGGYVYRGTAIPGIRGHYFYSDYCGAWLRSLRYEGGIAVDQRDWGLVFPSGAVSSFGRDFSGELYVVSGNSIYKIVAGP
jgi:glucose/arabinose dehydrogenase